MLLADLWERKLEISRELKRILGNEARAAERDHHSKRVPRPCGMTIHTGIGCSFGCVYCYVPDMGFPMKPRPYPLTPLQLVYALSLNPYVIPEITLAAYGSVTEPFLRETKERALSYIKEVWRWLKLPTQVSTKAVIDDHIISELLKGDKNLNVLVSVPVIGRESRILEPNSPSPEERFEGASKAVKAGIHVTLFLRPIIPGITEKQAEDILVMAKKVGIRDVVLGTLRVTEGILKRIEALKLYNVLNEIRRRLPRCPKDRKDQVIIQASDLKRYIAKIAKEKGLKVLPSSCSANIISHNEYCEACNLGPCGLSERKIRDPALEAKELLEAMNVKVLDLEYRKNSISVVIKKERYNVKLRTLLSIALRMRVNIRYV